jgi:membrane fusion protein (multidrug efflux system)
VLRETARGIGTLRAAERVTIKPEVTGRLVAVHFEEGAAVEAGAPLFTLDDARLRAQRDSRRAAVEQARARRRNAQRAFERVEGLFKRAAASEANFDDARTALQAAEAELDRAGADLALVEEQLADTRITAPFAGLVSESLADPGEYLEVGQPLATIYRIQPVEAVFSLPERLLGRVRVGQAVQVRVDAYPERTFDAQVTYVSPGVTETTRDFTAKAQLANPDGRLRPGSFATSEVVVQVSESRPVIPEEALVAARRGYLVFVVEDDAAHRRDVRIGLREPGRVEILEGLEPGEVVVTSGQMRLAEGTRVRQVRVGRKPEPPGSPDGSASSASSPSPPAGGASR